MVVHLRHRRLKLHPGGYGNGTGTHLSMFLEAQEAMWAPTAEYNQADASRSHSFGGTHKAFTNESWVFLTFIELSALKEAGAGWLVNYALVLTVNITVQQEDRFQLDAGGVPCDMALKLPCGVGLLAVGLFLQAASPFFRDALEDVKGSAPIPVDGNLGTWTYMLSCLYPPHDQPELTFESVYTLLPVVHKYNLFKLLTRLIAFIKTNGAFLSPDPAYPSKYVVRWLALAERLQLVDPRELCLARGTAVP
ncbi:hypothetical protein FOA52_004752 [Chlamydomonas sp. UWO 241]|nr:hypothetical protein FOA52_004752 [Chlamydomonas sp. UWO 241]